MTHDVSPDHWLWRQYYAPQDLLDPSKNSKVRVIDFSPLDRAHSPRNTTVASDEALCLATLINLDITKTSPLPSEARRPEVWDLLTEKNGLRIPSPTVFLEGPKTQRKGYRWAPSPLLPSSERFHIVQIRFLRWRSPQGTITPRGLLAEYPGFRLKPLRAPGKADAGKSGIGNNPWKFLIDRPHVRLIVKEIPADEP